MHEDDVFAAVAALVAAGEYLDEIPGQSGVNLDGGGAFGQAPDGRRFRLYQRGSAAYTRAKAEGWIDPLPPLVPASLSVVEEAEAVAGHPLPPLLRRLYLEVGNGGFGPGYGVLGLRGGHGGGGAMPTPMITEPSTGWGPTVPLLLCDWGCGITTEVDLADGQIWGSDPNPDPRDVSPTFPQQMDITQWFAKWLDGRLHQPWLMQDEVTGQWRGATDEETEAALAEWFD